jgi:pseudouridine synthase
MADAGVAARRACEALIEAGKVRVNGKEVRKLPIFIDPEHDRVEVEGQLLRGPERTMYLMVNKPAGVLVTAADEPGMDRRTVMDLIDHPSASRLFPVGRLDWESTGLVLMTNDGEMANRLTHPRYGVVKTYEVGVRGIVDDAAIEAVAGKYEMQARREDAEMGRATTGEIRPGITLTHSSKDGSVLRVTLREARNRQLREVLRYLGMPVKWLHRIAIGPLELSALGPGRWRELERDEVHLLREAARGRLTEMRPPRKKVARKPRGGDEGGGGGDVRVRGRSEPQREQPGGAGMMPRVPAGSGVGMAGQGGMSGPARGAVSGGRGEGAMDQPPRGARFPARGGDGRGPGVDRDQRGGGSFGDGRGASYGSSERPGYRPLMSRIGSSIGALRGKPRDGGDDPGAGSRGERPNAPENPLMSRRRGLPPSEARDGPGGLVRPKNAVPGDQEAGGPKRPRVLGLSGKDASKQTRMGPPKRSGPGSGPMGKKGGTSGRDPVPRAERGGREGRARRGDGRKERGGRGPRSMG